MLQVATVKPHCGQIWIIRSVFYERVLHIKLTSKNQASKKFWQIFSERAFPAPPIKHSIFDLRENLRRSLCRKTSIRRKIKSYGTATYTSSRDCELFDTWSSLVKQESLACKITFNQIIGYFCRANLFKFI